MVDGDHNHRPDEPGGEDIPGHPEHGAYWPPRPLARSRASMAIADLVENGESDLPAARSIVDRLRSTLRDLHQLDDFVEMVRRSLLGEGEALASARRWLESRRDRRRVERPQLTEQPEHGEPRRGVAFDQLPAEPWMHPSALLDLTIGAAFTSIDAERRGTLEAIGQQVVDVARTVAVTMTILADLPPDLEGRDRFDAFVEHLGDFDRFDQLPLDLGGCLAEMLDVLGRPDGALSRASQGSELEIDDNTGRIGSVAPDPVCTGARLTLTARSGQSFVERSGVTVAFAPCGTLGTDITWTPSTVEVTVPTGARSGPVYFACPDTTAGSTLPGTAASEIAGVFGNCPFLGRGSATSIMVGALHQPLDNARCFLPLSVGVPVGVTQTPQIGLFRAVAQNGSPITSQSLPAPDDPISLEWEVTAAAGTNPDVRILADGALLAQGLTLRGNYAIAKAQTTKTYSLVVTSGCGVVRSDFILRVLRVLSFDPPDVSIGQGQTATLSLRVDQPSPIATTILLTTLPDHPTAPGWVTIPAGQTPVPVSYPNVQPGPPRAAALTAIAYAPGCASATGRVWVDQPLGTHEVVADRTGQGRAAIDVVAAHAALTTTGSVLVFAYDESPSGYADINKGKSAVWDPRTNQVRSIPMSRNLFCAGHALLGDGRVLVAGGQSTAITVSGTIGSVLGIGRGADHDVHVFDGGAWSRVLPDMPGARWYPTCTTLPDGRVLIVSGYAAHAYGTLNSDYEIFDGATNSLVKRASFRTLLIYNHELDIYPFLQVLPGRNLFVHSHDTTWLLPLNSSNEPVIGSLGFTPFYNAQSRNSRTYPGEGACVMLPLDPAMPTKASVLVVGGGGGPHGGISPTTPASNTAEIFEYDSSLGLDAQAQWRFTRDGNGNQTFLTNPRLMADAVLLPDGTVAIVGGAGGGEADEAWPPIMWVESFDPATETFTMRSGITVPRLYHSTALLLPDGSVMIAGSTGSRWDQSISGGSDNEFRIEIYHPPYLFRGPRPILRVPTTTLTFGQSLRIEISTDGTEIQRAALIRHGTTTHTNNMDQRYVGLAITDRKTAHIDVTLPADGALAPPGPYLLFVISNDAVNAPVPSVGTSVLLGP